MSFSISWHIQQIYQLSYKLTSLAVQAAGYRFTRRNCNEFCLKIFACASSYLPHRNCPICDQNIKELTRKAITDAPLKELTQFSSETIFVIEQAVSLEVKGCNMVHDFSKGTEKLIEQGAKLVTENPTTKERTYRFLEVAYKIDIKIAKRAVVELILAMNSFEAAAQYGSLDKWNPKIDACSNAQQLARIKKALSEKDILFILKKFNFFYRTLQPNQFKLACSKLNAVKAAFELTNCL